MRLAIIGDPGAGKTTLFSALTAAHVDEGFHREDRLGTVTVPDARIDALSKAYRPKKTIYAQVTYFLPSAAWAEGGDAAGQQALLNKVRDCDALLVVLRHFKGVDGRRPDPLAQWQRWNQELILSDLVVTEKRQQRLELDAKRGKKPDPEEVALLQRCRQMLENERPLRWDRQLAGEKRLRGFAFLSAKPALAVFNNDDDDPHLPQEAQALCEQETCTVVRAKLEQELAQMAPDEARAFLDDFGITASAMDRMVAASYRLLGRISFFTVGEDEVRAWTIADGTEAVQAAGAIHSDMQKGFIRAEVLAYDDWKAAGSYAAARKQGTVRLEGKTYRVKDGDIITFRFNV